MNLGHKSDINLKVIGLLKSNQDMSISKTKVVMEIFYLQKLFIL